MIYSELADGVRTLTLQRPDAGNALTVEMRDDLVREVREARCDPQTRCVLLRAEGASFCAGMDLRESTVTKAGTPGFDPRSTAEALRIGVQTLVRELWELDKPTVAAVGGAAVGPGAHLALACDIVLVSPAARFMWSFAKWGLVVDAAGAYLLPRLVGLPRAKAMVLLGDGVRSGEDAVRDGLEFTWVDDLDAEAKALAWRLAGGPTRSLGLSKQLLNRTFETDLTTSLELEGAYQSLATASADLVEGMAAFREKRDPKFRGR
jgi:2-(1,2-epoxy-1,2-dihydrophenyl)acetyl-CoA isomerase